MGSLKPTFQWEEFNYGHEWGCRMTMPLSGIGISGDGLLMGNEEVMKCWAIKVAGTPNAQQRKYVEDVLYKQYLASLKPKPPKPKKDTRRMLLLCVS